MSDPTLSEVFAAEMGRLLGPDFPSTLGLAVSGGGDSMAMLALAHDWARVMGVALRVATVDHSLRPDSAAEAAMVGQECAALGHPHQTLRWDWDGHGNVQDAARRARLALIGAWCDGFDTVLFAHTQDDVAETLLMRLARGSGVEGLSAMADKRWASGFWQVRPLLGVSRADLRHHAKTLHVPFVDDPSNQDPRFDRVRARKALALLADVGITTDGLAGTAKRLGRAREALAARAEHVAQSVLRPDPRPTGQMVFDRDGFAAIERDTQLRLLAAALQWVANSDYRPRLSPLEALLDRALAGGGGTLHGGQILVDAQTLRIFREYRAVKDARVVAVPGRIWDGTVQVSTDAPGGSTVAALGDAGWQQILEKPKDTPPYAAALSLPALFDGETLIACPSLGFGPPFVFSDARGAASFLSMLQLR